MDRKRKGKDADKELRASPEFQAFETNLKEILTVPKKELERREEEEKKAKGK